MSADTVLDARDVDGEPFSHVTSALADLGADETLLLINGFEPEPPYDALAARGFEHETERVADDEWRVWISPG